MLAQQIGDAMKAAFLRCLLWFSISLAWRAEAQLRMVNGKIYNEYDPTVWTVFNCNFEIKGIIGDKSLCFSYTTYTATENTVSWGKYHSGSSQTFRDYSAGQQILLKNRAGGVGGDIYPPIKAIYVGLFTNVVMTRSGGDVDVPMQEARTYPVYDCGVPYVPPARLLTPEEQKAKAEKQKATEAKTVKWLESQAAAGSASAQCSLGMRYLKGQGVETNKALAIEWFKKAATQGDIEASNKLAGLASAQTNSGTSSTSATNSEP
jgi:hypothetical protein